MTFTKLTPMLNVADPVATVAWYRDLGFEVLGTDATDQEGDTFTWAMLRCGAAEIMINQRDLPAEAARGGNLYITVDDVDALWTRLKERVTVSEPLTDQFYGMRDFWIEDPNGYILGFGQDIREREASQ